MYSEFNYKNELAKVWAKKTIILGLSIGITIITSIYAFFLPDEFQSVAGFIPPNLSDVKSLIYSKEKFRGVGTGGDVDIERMMSILESENTVERIHNKFNLLKHYNINEEDPKTRAKKLATKFSKNFQLGTAKFTQVQILIYDEDPKMAANIANEFVAIADSFVESLVNRKIGLQTLKDQMKTIIDEKNKIIDSLRFYRTNYGLYHFDDMSDNISNMLASKSSNPEFNKNYDKVYDMELRLNRLDDTYSGLVEEKLLRERHLETNKSLLNIVSVAQPAKFKTKPVRSVIIIMAFISSLLIISIFVIAFDSSETNKN